jgi:hypothetical protein
VDFYKPHLSGIKYFTHVEENKGAINYKMKT